MATKTTTIENLVLALQKSENALNAACEERDEAVAARRKWKADAEAFHAAMLKARMERDEALQRVEFLEKEKRDAALARSGMAKLVWAREARERAEREAEEKA